MRPTLNPEGSILRDFVLIDRTNDKVDKLVGQVVYVERNERKVVKRLKHYKTENKYCWIESDANNNALEKPVRKYYDSNLFGYIPCDCVKGHVQAVVWPLHRIKRL